MAASWPVAHRDHTVLLILLMVIAISAQIRATARGASHGGDAALLPSESQDSRLPHGFSRFSEALEMI